MDVFIASRSLWRELACTASVLVGGAGFYYRRREGILHAARLEVVAH